MGFRQVIIVRKDLNMSAGKLMAQACHASMAFLTRAIRDKASYWTCDEDSFVVSEPEFKKEMFDEWFLGAFTKTVCEAKNKNKLMKAVEIAEELGLKEGEDYFLIRDNCLTELEPEDEDGRTLTAIGFVPLEDEVAHKISKKFQLFNAEIESSKKGKWIVPNGLCETFDIYECSACNERAVLGFKYKYCPNCGAEMINYESK